MLRLNWQLHDLVLTAESSILLITCINDIICYVIPRLICVNFVCLLLDYQFDITAELSSKFSSTSWIPKGLAEELLLEMNWKKSFKVTSAMLSWTIKLSEMRH